MNDPRPPARTRNPNLLARLHLELANEPCERCEQRPGVQLHHKRLRSQGGSDTRDNLAWLCGPCHDAAHGV